MCAIGSSRDTSVAGAAPTSTLLGSGAIGGSTNTGVRRVAGGASRSTILTGGGGLMPTPSPGGRPGNKNPQLAEL